MTATEIRKVQEELRDGRCLPLSEEGDAATAAVHLATWVAAFLPEIAAQLAELNDKLKSIIVDESSLALTTRSNDSVVVTKGGC